ncbi:MAG TPA: hypothetical protein PK274_09795 [Candidatus Fermentibacter daniensis]|nr:hypothetical protein [Candidatus Fermentibacter daniensis]
MDPRTTNPSDDSEATPSWESILDELKQNPELTPAEFDALKKALGILSRVLGDDFPALSMKRYHPLDFDLVHNKAAFPKKRLIWFAGAIELLSHQPGYAKLQKKLRRADGFDEAYSIVRFAYRLIAAGWPLEIDPRFNSPKQPDLRVLTPKGRPLAIEVTALTESERDKLINIGVRKMIRGLAGLSTTYITAGRLLAAPTEADLDRILEVSKSFANRLRTSGGFVEFCDPMLLELAGEPKDIPARLEAWAKDRSLRPHEYYCNLPDNDPHLMLRLLSKLQKEVAQVTDLGVPGLVGILCSEFTLDAGVIHERAEQLVSRLTCYPEVVGVVIYGTMGGAPENHLFAAPSHIYMEIQGGFYEAERWVFMPNPRSIGAHDSGIRRDLCETLAGQNLPWEEWNLGWA